MKILVAGTGALACVYAERLARVGRHDVVMFGHWPARVDALRRDGVCVVEDGEARVSRIPVLDRAEDIDGDLELVLVLTKSGQVDGRLAELAPAVSSETAVVCLQNGFSAAERLEAASRGAPMLGETHVAATKLDAGRTRLARLGETVIAPLSERVQPLAVRHVVVALGDGGLPARAVSLAHVRRLLWEKIVVAAGLNPLSIILGVPVSAIYASPHAAAAARRAMEEAGRVAALEGADVDVDGLFDEARGYGENLPSGLQDFLAGRASEIEDINGGVVTRARRAGLAAPVNDLLRTLVSALYDTAGRRVTPHALGAGYAGA